MIDTADAIVVNLCSRCGARGMPGPTRCSHCGAAEVRPARVPAVGTVLAATELLAPAAGWPSPHRLALVELEGAVRLLGVAEPNLPSVGARVRVRRDGDVYRVRPTDARGEGETPTAARSPRPFEPPRRKPPLD
jgi:uncharacterized OB-fold protein